MSRKFLKYIAVATAVISFTGFRSVERVIGMDQQQQQNQQIEVRMSEIAEKYYNHQIKEIYKHLMTSFPEHNAYKYHQLIILRLEDYVTNFSTYESPAIEAKIFDNLSDFLNKCDNFVYMKNILSTLRKTHQKINKSESNPLINYNLAKIDISNEILLDLFCMLEVFINSYQADLNIRSVEKMPEQQKDNTVFNIILSAQKLHQSVHEEMMRRKTIEMNYQSKKNELEIQELQKELLKLQIRQLEQQK